MSVTRSVRVVLSASVDGFRAELGKAAASVETLSTKIGEVSQTQAWSNASTDLLKLGVTLSSIGVIAAKMGSDFAAQMSAVSATGADAKTNIDELREAAIAAGAEFGQFTATEAADGITQLAKAGMSAADILSGGLRGSLAVAASGQMAVADAAELTAMTLTQFSLSGDKASHVADLLAAGAGKAVGEVSDLGQALSTGGGVAAQYGISIEETVGTLAMFAQNALVGAEAGTAMKSMLMQLAKPTKEAQATLDEYGIAVYDAQGKFVGLESLAGQLKTQLGGLSKEQQNAAMSTIFGAYAIRAANIMFKEGAEGVADWTAQVDDTGFAMTQAAALTDNLKGDIAELGGAFETVMIQVGESSQNGLRTVVQGLTSVIELAGQYPGITTGIVGFSTALGILALTAGGIMKLTTAFTAFKTSLDVLKISMTGLTLGAGAVGIGLAVLAGIVSTLATEHMEAKNRVDGFTNALKGSAEQTSLAAREQAALNLQQSGALGIAEKYGIALSTLTEASLGDSRAREQMTEKIVAQANAIKTQLDGMTNWEKDQSAAGRELSAQYAVLMGDLKSLTGDVDDNAEAYLEAKRASEQMKDATKENTAVQPGLQNELETTKQRVEEANVAHQEAIDLLRESANAALGLSGAEMNLHSAYLKAEEAVLKVNEANAQGIPVIDQTTGKINTYTQAGMDAKSALDNVASASLKVQDSMLEMGASTDDVRAKQVEAYHKFMDTASAMGVNADAAEEMAHQYGLVPTTVLTNAEFEKRSAEAALISWKTRLGELDGRRVTSYAETIYIQSGTKVLQYATGGAIRGPGTGTSDSIPALLSNGEHVITAAEVRAMGGHDAVFRLRQAALAGMLPKFATGGPIMATVNTDWRPPILTAAGNHSTNSKGIGGSGGSLNLTINNPIAEPVSKTISTMAAHFGMEI